MSLARTLVRLVLAALSVRLCRAADTIEQGPPALDPTFEYPPATLGAKRKAMAERLRTLAVSLGT